MDRLSSRGDMCDPCDQQGRAHARKHGRLQGATPRSEDTRQNARSHRVALMLGELDTYSLIDFFPFSKEVYLFENGILLVAVLCELDN